MSEANQSSQVTVDPATGEVVGGLAGLREIIRLKKEQQDVESAHEGSVFSQPDNTAKAATNRVKRRRNKRSKTDNAIDSDGDFRLPFRKAQAIYAEVTGTSVTGDAKIYVADEDRLYIYSKEIYPQNQTEYYDQATKLLADERAFTMAKVAGVQLFINHRADLSEIDGSLVYKGKYRIDSCNKAVYDMAIKLISEDDKNDTAVDSDAADADKTADKINNREFRTMIYQLSKNGGPKRLDLPDQQSEEQSGVEEIKEAQGNKMNEVVEEKKTPKVESDIDLVDKIVQIQQIKDQVSQSGTLDIYQAMEVFLLVGQASAQLLTKLTGLDGPLADAGIDNLRLMHALGSPNQDGDCPLLINSLDELGKDVGYTLQSEADNFRSVVHSETLRGKKLVYDLDAVCMVKLADAYLAQVAKFCRVSHNDKLRKLFAPSEESVVKLSDILRTISGDEDSQIVMEDFELFHQYVTKYMLVNNWLLDNPSDGYPWLQFNVSGTMNLTIDTLRYLANNVNWLTAWYGQSQVDSLIEQIKRLPISADDASSLRLQQIVCSDLVARLDSLAKAKLDNEIISPAQLTIEENSEATKAAKKVVRKATKKDK